MDNPIKTIRKKMDLTKAEYAILLDSSYDLVVKAESGSTAHPKKLFVGLEKLGYDKEELADNYQRFLEHKRDKILEKIDLQDFL